MANTQTSAGHFKRTLRWFGRHKVTAVFTSFLLIFLVWAFGSWVILQTQIHFERQRYETAKADVIAVRDKLKLMEDPFFKSYCYYESSTVEFIRGNRLCVVRLEITMQGANKYQAAGLASDLRRVVAKGMELNTQKPQNSYTLFWAVSKKQAPQCSVSVEYYPASAQAAIRLQGAPPEGSAAFAEIICSDAARADYFPVDKIDYKATIVYI